MDNELKLALELIDAELAAEKERIWSKVYTLQPLNLNHNSIASIPSSEQISDKKAIALIKRAEKIARLKRKIAKEGKQKPISNIPKYPKSHVWPTGFKWDEREANYLLNDRQFKFNAFKSTRKDIFREIISKQGEWVSLNNITQRVHKTKAYVRDVIGQLNKLIVTQKVDDLIGIIPKRISGEEGAYRVECNPKKTV